MHRYFGIFTSRLSFSGLVTGPVNNLRGKDLSLDSGRHQNWLGDIKFEGLPDIQETFILADINELTSSADDIKGLQSVLQTEKSDCLNIIG